MKEKILSRLEDCPWGNTLYWFDSIDSTNTRAKAMAADGAPHGTVLIAGSQTGGRGRLGRSFQSPEGMGVYLSVILRPQCPPADLMHLTCAAAVAMCDAVEQAAGFRPGIKWTNDIVYRNKKLGGILTELSLDAGNVAYAIVGIGINCLQEETDFPPELQSMAGSVSMAAGKVILPHILAADMILAIKKTSDALLSEKAAIMASYRKDCITLGKDVSVVRAEEIRHATALDIDDDGALTVRYHDGSLQTVTSGEVSIRGMYGYI